MAARDGRTAPQERSTGELVGQLTDQTKTLVRHEIELAKAELGQKGKKAGIGAGMFGGAGLFGVFAFAALTAALIGALDTAMPFWLAALVAAALYGAVAGVLALTGKRGTRRHGRGARGQDGCQGSRTGEGRRRQAGGTGESGAACRDRGCGRGVRRVAGNR